MIEIVHRRFATAPARAGASALLRTLNGRARQWPLPDVRRPIVVYGAGNLGLLARRYLEVVGHPPVLVVDKNSAAVREVAEWRGYPVVGPHEVPSHLKRDATLAIAVVTSPFAPLFESISDEGWQTCLPFYDVATLFGNQHPLDNGWASPALLPDELDAVDSVLDGWLDDRSRADHLRFLAWRLAREEWIFDDAPVDTTNRFFIPEVSHLFDADARLLDAGAHHGLFLDAHLKVAGSLRHAWAIEPDDANRHALNLWASRLPNALRHRIDVLPDLISDGPNDVLFHQGLDYASQIAPSGSPRRTNAIDALATDPTIVKLHLEGHELSALKGAIETITACRPLVMATIYHNVDGLFRTARWLMTNLADYDFLLRTHGWCGTGTVIYAVPRERRARH